MRLLFIIVLVSFSASEKVKAEPISRNWFEYIATFVGRQAIDAFDLMTEQGLILSRKSEYTIVFTFGEDRLDDDERKYASRIGEFDFALTVLLCSAFEYGPLDNIRTVEMSINKSDASLLIEEVIDLHNMADAAGGYFESQMHQENRLRFDFKKYEMEEDDKSSATQEDIFAEGDLYFYLTSGSLYQDQHIRVSYSGGDGVCAKK